tara:strand:+ start:1456 stop:2880 length:1425 start_codon:yes stop_codon:yes gene_type:complete
MSKQPNILLLTIDSLRPDHLGCYGYQAVPTPAIDHLASSGIQFQNAYCQAPNTWMSHAALFTGCNPPRNNIRSPLDKLNTTQPTLAEVLKNKGYETFGLPSVSMLSREAGFDRGFDHYDLTGLLSEFHGAVHFRDLQESLQTFSKWVSSTNKPWFVWLHYFGIHIVQGQLQDGRTTPINLPDSYLKKHSPYAQHYDSKIRFCDYHFVDPVLKTAHQHSDQNNLITVLLSDHGDDLHAIESGLPGHDGNLDEQAVRIPLIVCAPGIIPEKVSVSYPVRVIDLFPTLIDLIQTQPSSSHPDEKDNRTLIDGLSLTPLIHHSQETISRNVYLENLYQGCLGLRRDRYKLILSFQENSHFLERHVRWRLDLLAQLLIPDRIQRPFRNRAHRKRQREHFRKSASVIVESLCSPSSRTELFDLHQDPHQQHDIAAQHPDVVQMMKADLCQLATGETVISRDYSPEEEAEIEKHLDELGYL